MTQGRHVLAVRLDNAGDVLLMGPAVRAIAAAPGVERVTMLCGPAGAEAARMLPGVDDVVVHRCGWVVADPGPVDRAGIDELVDELAARRVDEAVVFTSFHQSPLPTALVLRMAGVKRVSAISIDYPGSLLDVRHLVDDDIHEVERALSLTAAAGFPLPPGDDARLRVRRRRSDAADAIASGGPYVVVHPGVSAPARAWSPSRFTALVAALVDQGRRVVITGGPDERALTAAVSGGGGGAARGPAARAAVVDVGGTLTLPDLAEVLAAADAVIVANTGPAHLAAAVGTPVVSIFAPVVPAVRWRPWAVPHVLLGEQDISCAGCRARVCPRLGHPCVEGVEVADVLGALEEVATRRLETEVTA